jgi:hypothetical protein
MGHPESGGKLLPKFQEIKAMRNLCAMALVVATMFVAGCAEKKPAPKAAPPAAPPAEKAAEPAATPPATPPAETK